MKFFIYLCLALFSTFALADEPWVCPSTGPCHFPNGIQAVAPSTGDCGVGNICSWSGIPPNATAVSGPVTGAAGLDAVLQNIGGKITGSLKYQVNCSGAGQGNFRIDLGVAPLPLDFRKTTTWAVSSHPTGSGHLQEGSFPTAFAETIISTSEVFVTFTCTSSFTGRLVYVNVAYDL